MSRNINTQVPGTVFCFEFMLGSVDLRGTGLPPPSLSLPLRPLAGLGAFSVAVPVGQDDSESETTTAII